MRRFPAHVEHRPVRFGFVRPAELLPGSADVLAVGRRRRQTHSTASPRPRPTAPPPTTIRPGKCRRPTAIAQTAQVLSTTNFLNTSNVPLTPGATSDTKTGAGQSEAFLALQCGQFAVRSGQDGAKLHRHIGPARGPQYPLPDRPFTGRAISLLDQLQQFHPAGGDAVGQRRRSTATIPLQRLHLQHPAAGHQRQYQQSGARAFRLRQLHHRGAKGRHHHQCADRSFPGSGPADPGQHRQLHQFAAFGRRLLDPLPEDRSRAAPPPRMPTRPMACRSRPAPTRRFRSRPPPRLRSIWRAIPAPPRK